MNRNHDTPETFRLRLGRSKKFLCAENKERERGSERLRERERERERGREGERQTTPRGPSRTLITTANFCPGEEG